MGEQKPQIVLNANSSDQIWTWIVVGVVSSVISSLILRALTGKN